MIVLVVVVVVGVVHSVYKHTVGTNHLYVDGNCSAKASMAMNMDKQDNALPINAQKSQPVRQAMATKLNSAYPLCLYYYYY